MALSKKDRKRVEETRAALLDAIKYTAAQAEGAATEMGAVEYALACERLSGAYERLGWGLGS